MEQKDKRKVRKSRTSKGERELQIIGAKPKKKASKVIRSDVVTNLDIIGDYQEFGQYTEKPSNQYHKKVERRQSVSYHNASRSNRPASGNGSKQLDYILQPRQASARNNDELERRRQIEEKRRKKKKRARNAKIVLGITVIAMLVAIVYLIKAIWGMVATSTVTPQNMIVELFEGKKRVAKPEITENFLDINEYSRPGEKLPTVKNIFVHYTANPGTTALQNRSYFESLAESGETSASAHFIIGYDGEIIQCIPLDEIGYAVMEHNYDSVSIECCYLAEDGSFTDATYESLLHLTTWLMGEYRLKVDDVLRHYDASGKLCPKYYVQNPDAWDKFRADLENYKTRYAE